SVVIRSCGTSPNSLLPVARITGHRTSRNSSTKFARVRACTTEMLPDTKMPPPGSPLEIVDFRRRTAADDSRVGPRTPWRTIEGRREHDLRQAVELVRKRLFVALFHVRPIAAEHVVCDATEQHGVALVHE